MVELRDTSDAGANSGAFRCGILATHFPGDPIVTTSTEPGTASDAECQAVCSCFLKLGSCDFSLVPGDLAAYSALCSFPGAMWRDRGSAQNLETPGLGLVL